MNISKQCSRCHKEFPLEEFTKNCRSKDGLSYYCRLCSNAQSLASYHKKPERHIKAVIASREKNKKHYQEYHRDYMRVFRKTNVAYRFRKKIASKIKRTLKKMNLEKGGVSTNTFLGCTPKELKTHLEKQFTPEMNWGNYGTLWHIDHIIPRAAFKSTIEDMIKCWNYTNLQPLLGKDNEMKSDFLPCGSRARKLNREESL